MSRSILLISHFYPPSDMVAARRPAGLAKYLERLGHRVTVLTSGAWGERGKDEEPATSVLRTGDLMTSRLNWRRDQLRSWTGEAEGANGYEAGVSWPARLLVPDVAVLTWLPYLFAAAMSLARRDHFDCVLTSSGPESTHLVGPPLKRAGLAWVADFRDGWGFETLHVWPTPVQAALDFWLERKVVTHADAVSAVTEPISVDLRERFAVDAWTITNGFDPEEMPTQGKDHGLLNRDRHSLLHTGRMASSQRSPQPVLEAFRLLRDRAPEVAQRVELALAGPLTPGERQMAEAPDVRENVRLLGSLPRERVLELQRAADSLLLLTAGNRTGEATGKLYEYLSAGRPVLVLGEATEAARIVRETGAGVVVPADDPSAVAEALAALVIGGGETAPEGSRGRDAYGYPVLAERMAELVELACQRRSRA